MEFIVDDGAGNQLFNVKESKLKLSIISANQYMYFNVVTCL